MTDHVDTLDKTTEPTDAAHLKRTVGCIAVAVVGVALIVLAFVSMPIGWAVFTSALIALAAAMVCRSIIIATSPWRVVSDKPFYTGLVILGGSYLLLIVLMLAADITYAVPHPRDNPQPGESPWVNPVVETLKQREIQYSIWLSVISCTITTVVSLWVAVPIGYLMSRHEFRGKNFVDAMLDIPIVLPPLVVGISLLVLFRILGEIEFGDSHPLKWLQDLVVFELPAVILAQFMVACAFAVRTMRATFDQIPSRREQVALTLGCTRSQAFFHVVMPDCQIGC